jgi:hypothetical protein
LDYIGPENVPVCYGGTDVTPMGEAPEERKLFLWVQRNRLRIDDKTKAKAKLKAEAGGRGGGGGGGGAAATVIIDATSEVRTTTGSHVVAGKQGADKSSSWEDSPWTVSADGCSQRRQTTAPPKALAALSSPYPPLPSPPSSLSSPSASSSLQLPLTASRKTLFASSYFSSSSSTKRVTASGGKHEEEEKEEEEEAPGGGGGRQLKSRLQRLLHVRAANGSGTGGGGGRAQPGLSLNAALVALVALWAYHVLCS